MLDRRTVVNALATLLESHPTFPNPGAASIDTSRILRADYGSPYYTALAHEAQKFWRDTSSPDSWGADGRYHESGFALISDKGKGEPYVKRCLENIRNLKESGVEGVGNIEVLNSREDVKRVTGGIMSGNWGYVNWGSGWANAEKTMTWAMEGLDRNRVDVRTGAEVSRLLFRSSADGARSVEGVELADGQKLYADLVVLAIGAWTHKLIDLRGRTEATGQILTYLSLTEEEQKGMSGVPVTMSMATGIYTLPQQDGTLKIGRNSYGYRNPMRVCYPIAGKDQGVSTEEIEVSLPRLNIPVPLEGREACRDALLGLEMSNARDFKQTRVCWYTDTQQGNFLIATHPDYDQTLFLATGGSGHAFKFFPVIGEKIVDAIEGRLDPHLRELWAWPSTSVEKFAWEVRPDGSRGGRIGMDLDTELKRVAKL